MTCGSSETLPLVITTGRSSRRRQKMQRRRRQHETERRKPRRDRLRQALRPVASSRTIGASGLAEQPLFARIDGAIAADDLDVARHQGEGLRVAPLRAAKARDGVGVGRVAGELITAQPLDGDDLALLA